MFSHFLKFETMIIDTFLFEGLADERNMWWWWTSLIFACSTLINSLRCSLTILEIIYCNISSMEVLYTICFRIILLSFRKSTMTRIIPVLVQGTCGSDSIYGWNLRVEKFHLSFRILPAFVGHKGKLLVTVRVFLLSLRQSNTNKKLSLTIVNNVVYFCQYLKKIHFSI